MNGSCALDQASFALSFANADGETVEHGFTTEADMRMAGHVVCTSPPSDGYTVTVGHYFRRDAGGMWEPLGGVKRG